MSMAPAAEIVHLWMEQGPRSAWCGQAAATELSPPKHSARPSLTTRLRTPPSTWSAGP